MFQNILVLGLGSIVKKKLNIGSRSDRREESKHSEKDHSERDHTEREYSEMDRPYSNWQESDPRKAQKELLPSDQDNALFMNMVDAKNVLGLFKILNEGSKPESALQQSLLNSFANPQTSMSQHPQMPPIPPPPMSNPINLQMNPPINPPMAQSFSTQISPPMNPPISSQSSYLPGRPLPTMSHFPADREITPSVDEPQSIPQAKYPTGTFSSYVLNTLSNFYNVFQSLVNTPKNATNTVYVEGVPYDTSEREVARIFNFPSSFRYISAFSWLSICEAHS